jgi:hypothetical protein
MKKYKIGDKFFHPEDQIDGEVIEGNWCCVKVKWSDGLYSCVHPDDIPESWIRRKDNAES